MSLTALALVLGAGLLHAAWNLILKGAKERLLVAAWGLLAGAAVFSPVLIAAWPVPRAAWPFACASAAVLLAYYACLARAYERGDFSLVYPVARGVAPALLALWAALFLGERPSVMGVLGIATVLMGLVVLGGAPLWQLAGSGPPAAPWRSPRTLRSRLRTLRSRLRTLRSRLRTLRSHAQGAGAAFMVAFLVSVYTAIDAAGVRHWAPLPYLVLVFALSGSALVPLLALREALASRAAARRTGHRPARGAGAVVHVLRTDFPRILAIAVMTLVAYSLVLTAFQIAPVSYAGAVRESGIVFGALAGWLLLGECFGAARTAGAVLVFAGIGLLAAAG